MLKAVFTGVALFVMLSGGISFAASKLKVNDIDSVLISSSKGSAYKEPEPLEEVLSPEVSQRPYRRWQ